MFDGDYYDQIDGVAMGFPLGPVLANIFMGNFEEKWVVNVDSRPSIWFRYVDDTFALFDNVASASKSLQYLNDRKTEHFKALTQDCHASALADHVISTSHNIKWDHFEIIATGKSDLQCKIKETLFISDLKPSLNENVGSEKLFLNSFLPVVSTIGSINFVIVFYLVTSSPLYFCIFKCL